MRKERVVVVGEKAGLSSAALTSCYSQTTLPKSREFDRR